MDPYSFRNKMEILEAIDATKPTTENFGDNGKLNLKLI